MFETKTKTFFRNTATGNRLNHHIIFHVNHHIIFHVHYGKTNQPNMVAVNKDFNMVAVNKDFKAGNQARLQIFGRF